MTEDEINDLAIRKLFADEVRLFRAPKVADKIETNEDHNPRTLAAIRLIRKLSGLKVAEIKPPRVYERRLPQTGR